MTEPEFDERAGRAFRDAVTQSSPADLDVDLVAVQQRTGRGRRRRGAAAAIASVLIVTGGFLAVRVASDARDDPARTAIPNPAAVPSRGQPAGDPAPAGWRTEYFRSISFEVPNTWVYAHEPGSDWCVDSKGDRPASQHRRPYVSLGEQTIVRDILCPTMPTSVLTEHVVIFEPGAAADYALKDTRQQGDFWIVLKNLGGAVLRVTSPDRGRAERIIDSAVSNPRSAPCRPADPVGSSPTARPPAIDLAELRGVRHLTICQYDPDDLQGQQAHGLRAKAELSGAAAVDAVTSLLAAPVNRATACTPAPEPAQPDIALRLLITSAAGTQEVYVRAYGCPDGDPSPGGIDDGRTVRTLTRTACRALLVPPISLRSGSGDIGENCLA